MTGSKLRRPLTSFTELRKQSKAISSSTGSVLTGGNPAGFILEDTNGNSWYMWIDVTGQMRIAPAASVEPNPQTAIPSADFASAAQGFSATPFQKNIGSIADNTFTDLFTVTCPNVAIGATLIILTQGAIGAGGAVGADEVVATELKTLSVARVGGVNVVGNLGSAAATSNAAVAGATTLTLTTQLSSVSGGVSASNTFTFQIRVTKGGGASSNHTGSVMVWLYNNAATGVTLS